MALDFEQFKEFLEQLSDEQISKLAPAFDEARKSASDFTDILGEQSKQLKAIQQDGEVLYYANDELRNDKEVVLTGVNVGDFGKKQNGGVFWCAWEY